MIILYFSSILGYFVVIEKRNLRTLTNMLLYSHFKKSSLKTRRNKNDKRFCTIFKIFLTYKYLETCTTL